MKTQFFAKKAIPKILLALHIHTLVILHTDFGSIWTTPGPDEKDLFLKILYREIQKLRMKFLLFLGKLYQKFFFLFSYNPGDIPYQVWYDLDNSFTRWKRTIFKIRKNSQFAKLAKFRMKTQFFP